MKHPIYLQIDQQRLKTKSFLGGGSRQYDQNQRLVFSKAIQFSCNLSKMVSSKLKVKR